MKARELLDLAYLTRARAAALGFTHEGALFGIPAWIMNPASEAPLICPKVPALQLACIALDAVLEFAAGFLRDDQCLATPIRVDGTIGSLL